MTSRLWLGLWLSWVCFALGCEASKPPAVDPVALRRLEATARKALEEGNSKHAAELARQILQQAPNSVEGLLIAGYTAENEQRIDEAFKYYSQIPDNADPRSLEGRCLLAQLLFFDKGRAADAERCYRRVLEFDPGHSLAHQGLASVMRNEGRSWESIPHLLHAIRAGRCEIDNLLAVGWVQVPSATPAVLQHCRKEAPDDPLPLLGLARVAVRENANSQAEQLLRELVQSRPNQIEAQALLGRVLVNSPDPRAWLSWHAQLPPEANEVPETWFVRGLWAENHEDSPVAARCFAECCRRDADHPEANYRLYRVLLELGHAQDAAPFLERSRQLEQLNDLMSLVHARHIDVETVTNVAQRLEGLGRIWEAWGWWQFMATAQPASIAPREARRLRKQVSDAPLERTQSKSNPALALDLQRFSLPNFQPSENPRLVTDRATQPSQIRFEDQAQEVGINFSYTNGLKPGSVGLHMHESTGGGVAVVDFDGDLWPDLYLTQGCDWSRRGQQREDQDRLYRHAGDGRFVDVTQVAGLGDRDFSQGATVGDFNNDGFPDLYVANVGLNRLYRNNGDGTFTDVSSDRSPAAEYWSTSVVMADFNGDGWPDLFDGTYVGGDRVYTRLCEKKGVPRVCSPLVFSPERDRLYLNRGDGRFEEVGEAVGISSPSGKGLGVVAADFDGSGRLGVFVANDMEANSFFSNQSPRRGIDSPMLVDRALVSGLAVDADGRAQACMGVAAGDANGDGRLDLFVTNYHMESNTLYLQQSDGLFVDSTRTAGLRDPSFSMLGFGAQFLDLDSDGHQDLVIANGHVDDFRADGIPFQMSPQAFHNLGAGRFIELAAKELGQYFEGKYLGRGLVRLDWNRDGLEDFAVSHLDRPFALVTNRTKAPGNFLGIVLRGVSCDRDAIGATVVATVNNKRLVRQLTAGDGYMASNHRELVFGLGSASQVDDLEVRWPSGTKQSFSQLRANEHLVIIEGHPELVALPN